MRKTIFSIPVIMISFALLNSCSPAASETEPLPTETEALQSSGASALDSLSPATPQPVPYPALPDGYTPADYFAGWYGVFFGYPETWSIIDYSFQMEAEAVIFLRDREGGEIYLYPHSVLDFGTADPAEIITQALLQESSLLFNHYQMVSDADGELLELSPVGDPEISKINGQNVASVVMKAVFLVEGQNISIETMLTEIVNGSEAVLVIGYPSEDVQTFTQIFAAINSTVVLLPRSGPAYWEAGSVFSVPIAYHGITPNLYAIHAPEDDTLLFVATSESNCKPGILIYDAEEISSPVIHQPGSQDKLISPLAAASTRYRNSDVGMVFESSESRDYIVGVQGCSSYAVYFWSLSEEENIRVHQQGSLAAGEQQQWQFEGRAGDGVPIMVMHDGQVDLRFEVQDSEGNLLNILPLQSEEGQPIGYVFTPEDDGAYILVASNQGENQGEYTLIIGSINP